MSFVRRVVPGLLAALLGVSAAQANDRYMIEMNLWIDGTKRGEPMLIIEPGEPAEISSTDSDARSGWKIELEVEPQLFGNGGDEGMIWLHLAIYQLVEGSWEYLTNSIAGVPEGEDYSLSVAEDGEASGPENALVYLTAVTSRLKPAEG